MSSLLDGFKVFGASSTKNEVYELYYPDAYFVGDLARQLGPGHRRAFPAWYVRDTSKKGKPERVAIVRLRGPLDSETSRSDYAELEDGRVVVSTYLFPARGRNKPRFMKFRDEYGEVSNWVSLRRGFKPKKISP